MAARQVRLSDVVGKGYADFWQASQRYRVVKGSRASKKSTTAAMWYIVNMMAKPAANLLVVRRYGRTLKDSCFAQLRWAIDRLGVSEYWRAQVHGPRRGDRGSRRRRWRRHLGQEGGEVSHGIQS